MQYLVNKVRHQRLHQLQLKPNCLLTRYPIVFLCGRRSPFYFLNYWNQIPDFLREHGYDVATVTLPWRDLSKSAQTLGLVLSSYPHGCHLVGDSTIESHLIFFLERQIVDPRMSQIRSMTIIEAAQKIRQKKRKQSRRDRPSADDLRPSPIHSRGIRRWYLSPSRDHASQSRQVPRLSTRTHGASDIFDTYLWRFIETIQTILIDLHNFSAMAISLIRPPCLNHLPVKHRNLNPIEVGAASLSMDWDIEAKFLDFAISLAEDDAR